MPMPDDRQRKAQMISRTAAPGIKQASPFFGRAVQAGSDWWV